MRTSSPKARGARSATEAEGVTGRRQLAGLARRTRSNQSALGGPERTLRRRAPSARRRWRRQPTRLPPRPKAARSSNPEDLWVAQAVSYFLETTTMWPAKIAPKVGASDFDKESFVDWYRRIKPLIPHVPENVAEHWLHRHWGYSPYESLPLARLRFSLQTWPLERFHRVEYGSTWKISPNNCNRLYEPEIRSTRLAQLMLATGTWPAPVIILDNHDGSLKHRGRRMAPWQLIEGHLRLWYLRCLESRNEATAFHQVWEMTVAPRVRRDA
jgi:hypothetical protein